MHGGRCHVSGLLMRRRPTVAVGGISPEAPVTLSGEELAAKEKAGALSPGLVLIYIIRSGTASRRSGRTLLDALDHIGGEENKRRGTLARPHQLRCWREARRLPWQAFC